MKESKYKAGERFGRLVLMERVGTRIENSGFSTSAIWRTMCDCGEFIDMSTMQIREAKYHMCSTCRLIEVRKANKARRQARKEELGI